MSELWDDAELQHLFAWEEIIDNASYYEILGILEIADEGAIKQAFHAFSLAFHPDLHLGLDELAAVALQKIYQRGVEAYRTLCNPRRRADYDALLAQGHLRLGSKRPSVPRSSGPSLIELCHSSSARLHAKRADALIGSGDLARARQELLMALHQEGKNPELEDRIDALDLALFAMGQ